MESLYLMFINVFHARLLFVNVFANKIHFPKGSYDRDFKILNTRLTNLNL